MKFLFKILLCVIQRKHKACNYKRYFPFPPICLNCGWAFRFPNEKIYDKACKERAKLNKTIRIRTIVKEI